MDATTGELVKYWQGDWIPIADYQRRLSARQKAWAQEKADRKALKIATENAVILCEAYQSIA